MPPAVTAITLATVRIDLHTHSTASDGTDSPAQVLERAAAAAIDVVALTDHDSIAGWEEAAAAVEPTGVVLVRGAEVSASAGGIPVHILSYLHDPADRALAQLLEHTRTMRVRRGRAMVEGLARDFPITWEAVVALAGDAQTVGRPHMADALVAAGVFPDRDAAFVRVLHTSGPYHLPLEAPHPRDVVTAIRAAGGVPVMAHPLAAKRGRVVGDDVIADLVDHGLAALEAFHRDHDPAAVVHARTLAARLGIPVTGASDYHGAGKPNRLGENLTTEAVFEALVGQGRIEVLRPAAG